MIKIVLIGSGNIAFHLIQKITNTEGLFLAQVFARNTNDIALNYPNLSVTNIWKELKEADVYILAVSDNAIEEVSNQIPFENKLVVHTAGSVAMTQLSIKNRRGVLYPVQTFSKNKIIDFSKVTFCIEADNQNDYQILEEITKLLSAKSIQLNSEQRLALHISAVFVSNFTNHMCHLANEICQQNNIDFDLLKPLIIETAQKVNILSPLEAQTGPAIRNDFQTIQKHTDFLSENNLKNIYQLITTSIQQTHGKEL